VQVAFTPGLDAAKMKDFWFCLEGHESWCRSSPQQLPRKTVAMTKQWEKEGEGVLAKWGPPGRRHLVQVAVKENKKVKGNKGDRREFRWETGVQLAFRSGETVTIIISNFGNVSEQWSNRESRASQGNTMKLLSANINSWKKNGEYLLGKRYDIMALQETRHSEVTKISAKQFCNTKGYTAHFGKGMRNQFLQNKSAATAAQGGVGIVARQATCPGMMEAGADSKEGKMLYEQGRYKRVAIPIEVGEQRFALHVATMHNIPQNTEIAQVNKERNHARMLEDCARVGEQPVILCLDTNMRKSGVLEAAIQSGRYIDVAEKFAGKDGPEPTYCQDKKWDKEARGEGKTRPDRILVNRVAWEMVTGFRLWKECIIPGHIPLELTLNGNAIAKTQMVMKVPKLINTQKVEDVADDKKEKIAEAIWEKGKEAFYQAKGEERIDAAWYEASAMAERFLKKCLRLQGEKVENEMERGRPMERIEQNLAAPVSKNGKEIPRTRRGDKNCQAEERIRRAQIKLSISEGRWKDEDGKTKDWTEEQKQGSRLLARAEMIHLWKKIKGDLKTRQAKCKPLMEVGVPVKRHLDWAQNMMVAIRKKEEKEDAENRMRAWRRKINTAMDASATKEARAALRRIMKKNRQPPIVAVQMAENEEKGKGVRIGKKRMAVSSGEIHEQIAKAWHEIFNQPEKGTFEEFVEKYEDCIRKAKCEIGKLKVEKLKEAIDELNDDRAVASCGWRVPEMKLIPQVLLEPFAMLLEDIEEGGDWPTFMGEIYTTMIEKEDDPDIMEVAAENFAVPEPLGMRPINNFSPWYSAWSKVRFKEMAEWREEWMPEGMHGARDTHEALEVVYEHTLYMEKQTAEGKPAAAISLDWKKFFDSIQRKIGQGLVKKMTDEGNGKKVFEAEERLLEKIKPRFKVGKTVTANPYEKTNGFMQGPNYSITVALATLSVWTRTMESKVRCDTSSFIDDSSIRTKENLTKKEVVDTVELAMKTSQEFGEISGTELNKKKVKILINDVGVERQVKERLPGIRESAYRKAMVLVGGAVTTGQKQQTAQERAAIEKNKGEKVRKTLLAIERTRQPFEKLERMVGTYAMTQHTYGCGVSIGTWDQEAKLAGRIHTVITKGKTRWKCRTSTMTLHAKGHMVEPWQASRYTALRTIRRIAGKREKMRNNFRTAWRDYLKRKEEKKDWKAYGPISIAAQILQEIRWEMDDNLICTRKKGGKVSLIGGEDGLFDHILRADLRRAMWERSGPFKDREEFEGGLQEKGIDYEATVKLSREKYGRQKAKKENGYILVRPNMEDVLADHKTQRYACEGDRYKLSKEKRGILRSIQSGSIMTGHRLFRAGLRPTAVCLTCETALDDTLEHAFWGCENNDVKQLREELEDKYGKERLRNQPNCVKICGLIPDERKFDDFFAEIATGEEEDELEPPPNLEEDDIMSEDSEGFLIVAGDGACPGGQADRRIVRSGSGLYYGKDHSHNRSWKTKGPMQNAQRAEVDAAWRWAAWAWSKQVYLTDSQQVHGTLSKIIGGEKIKVKKHRDLWRKIERAIRAKGEDNFKTRKIKAHQTKKEKEEESVTEKRLRVLNEGADIHAVKGAEEHLPNKKMIEVRQEFVKMCWDIQLYLMEVVSIRGKALDNLGIGRDRYEKRCARCKEVGEKLVEVPDEEEGKEEQEEEEGTGQKDTDLLEDRTKAFPLMWWEPRVTDEKNLTTIVGEIKEEIKVDQRNWARYYPYAMFEPLLWFWRTAQWDMEMEDLLTTQEEKKKDVGAGYTTWIVMAADFHYLTGVPLCKADEIMENRMIEDMAKFFRQASRTLWTLVGCEEQDGMRGGPLLKNLGAPLTAGLKGRMKVRRPEKVNQLLHKAAIKFAMGKGPATFKGTCWKIVVNWPDVGVIGWKEKRSVGGVWQGVEMVEAPHERKRLRRKQQEPDGWQRKDSKREANNPLTEVKIKIVEQIREKPAYRSGVRDSIVWTKEEKEMIEKVKHMPDTYRVREERRLLFNRTAKEKGYHEYLPFKGKEAKVVCRLCKQNCDLSQKNGINWKRAEKQCPENKAHCVEKNTKKVEMRNNNFIDWNNKNRGKNRHLYYLVEEKSAHLLACRRPGCKLAENPNVWPNRPASLGSMPLSCKGSILPWEKNGKQMENLVIPPHLVTPL